MAVAVVVLVTVIIILIVAIVFILHKNYQYQRKNCLKTVQYDNYNEPDSVLSSGQPETILYQTGLRGRQISDEIYPLYSSYDNNTILTYPYNSYRPPPTTMTTNHYATTDLMYAKDSRHVKNSAFLI
jgi:hypothetical protein